MMLWMVNLSVADTIDPQSDKFVMGVKTKAIGNKLIKALQADACYTLIK